MFSLVGEGSCILSFGSSVGERGEKFAGGNTGCMLEDSPGGELGLNPFGRGGGVADMALGDDGLEVAGEDGRGDCCSPFGLPGFLGDGLCICKWDGPAESSTSWRSDCRKLGAELSSTVRGRGCGEATGCGVEDGACIGLTRDCSWRAGVLVLRLLGSLSGEFEGKPGRTGEEVRDLRFGRRSVLDSGSGSGSVCSSRASLKAFHAAISSSVSCGWVPVRC